VLGREFVHRAASRVRLPTVVVAAVTPPPRAATTPTASPTPAAPALPAAAREDTPTGAETFARYYIEVLDYASHTGDIRALAVLGNCGTCRAQVDGIKKFFAAGGHVEGGQIRVTDTESIRFETSAALVNVTYDQAAGKSVNADGGIDSSPALRGETFALTLGRSKGSWSVRRMQSVQ
jgi:Family of unknown function (DUF6318)